MENNGQNCNLRSSTLGALQTNMQDLWLFDTQPNQCLPFLLSMKYCHFICIWICILYLIHNPINACLFFCWWMAAFDYSRPLVRAPINWLQTIKTSPYLAGKQYFVFCVCLTFVQWKYPTPPNRAKFSFTQLIVLIVFLPINLTSIQKGQNQISQFDERNNFVPLGIFFFSFSMFSR